MFVKSIMIPKFSCHTIDHEATVKEALAKLEENQIEGMPVLDGENYVGIVTKVAIFENYFHSELAKENYLQETAVKEIATYSDRYLVGNEIFEKTLINLKKFPLLAVLDKDKKFLGIVTRFDVLEQFQSAFGMNRPGVRIAFTSSEGEGRIARFSEIAAQFREQIISLVTFDETDKLVRRIVIKVESSKSIDKFIAKLEDSGFRILDVYKD